MSALTLTVSATIGLATAALLAYAGRVIQHRPVSRDQARASHAFAAWWYSASTVILLSTLRTTFALFGIDRPAVHVTLSQLVNFPLAFALGCLMFYILFVLTGRSLHWLVAPVYALYFAYLTWFQSTAGEAHVEIGPWQARLVGEMRPTPLATLVFGLVLALPVLVTVVVYCVLAFRLREASQLYRVRVVSLAFLGLFGSITLSYVLRWNEQSWFPLTYELPALAASLLVVAAYRPPAWVQRRFHVEPVSHAPR